MERQTESNNATNMSQSFNINEIFWGSPIPKLCEIANFGCGKLTKNLKMTCSTLYCFTVNHVRPT